MVDYDQKIADVTSALAREYQVRPHACQGRVRATAQCLISTMAAFRMGQIAHARSMRGPAVPQVESTLEWAGLLGVSQAAQQIVRIAATGAPAA